MEGYEFGEAEDYEGRGWCYDRQCPLLSVGYWGHPLSSHLNSDVSDLFEITTFVDADGSEWSGQSL